LGQVSAVNEGLQDAIDRRLRDAGALIDSFERERMFLILQQLEYVERLGENGYQVKPLGR
jgi:hypothetical protein